MYFKTVGDTFKAGLKAVHIYKAMKRGDGVSLFLSLAGLFMPDPKNKTTEDLKMYLSNTDSNLAAFDFNKLLAKVKAPLAKLDIARRKLTSTFAPVRTQPGVRVPVNAQPPIDLTPSYPGSSQFLPVPAAGGLPKWAIPAMIAAGAVVGFTILKRRR